MSDGLLKPEKDFSKDADKLIPESEQLAKVQIAYLRISI
jgi:26S proteasome regulatory subunit N5